MSPREQCDRLLKAAKAHEWVYHSWHWSLMTLRKPRGRLTSLQWDQRSKCCWMISLEVQNAIVCNALYQPRYRRYITRNNSLYRVFINSNYRLKYTSVSTQSDNLLSSLTCPSGCNLGCSLPLPNVLFHCQLRQILRLSGVAFIVLISRSLWMEICSLALGWACGQVLSLIFSSYYILQNAHRRTKYLGSFYRQWRETVPSGCKTA